MSIEVAGQLVSRSYVAMTLKMMEQFGVPSPQELMLVTKQLLYFERYARVHAPNWALARDLN